MTKKNKAAERRARAEERRKEVQARAVERRRDALEKAEEERKELEAEREKAIKQLNNRDARYVGRVDRSKDRIAKAVDRLPHLLVSDYVGPEADGFPAGGDGGPRGSEVSRPTQSAALSKFRVVDDTDEMEYVDTPDPVHERIKWILEAMDGVMSAGELLETRMRALDVYQGTRRYDPSGTCLCCDRYVEGTANDRLRGGMCSADYAAWRREGSPDRATFVRTRKQAS